MAARGEVPLEAPSIEPEPGRVAQEVALKETVLSGVEQVVHLPEPALSSRRFGRFGRKPRVRVYRVERGVPENEAYLVPGLLERLLYEVIGPAAVGALLVPVLHESHRSLLRPPEVVSLPTNIPRCSPRSVISASLCTFSIFPYVEAVGSVQYARWECIGPPCAGGPLYR